MNKFILAILLLIPSSWALAESSISGWVHAAGGITPIHPVAIELVDPVTGELVPGFRTVNLEDGTYEIKGVPEGSYKIFFDAFGAIEHYVDELSGNEPCDNGGCDRVEIGTAVRVGSRDVTINTLLTSGTILAGTVTDTARKPIAGITIETFDENGEITCCTRVTDENGEWSKTVEWPNTYYVRTRFDRTSGYQAEIWNDRPCELCDPVFTGSPIYVERKPARFINFELDKIEVPEERQAVDAEKLSGSWFDPARDGEGFIVEVLDRLGPSGQGPEVIVFWFTYTPDADQAWMVGSGELIDGQALVQFEFTSGAKFGAKFDPADVVKEKWGSVQFDFINCNAADAHYKGDFGSGTLLLTRLTSIHGQGCDDDSDDGEPMTGNSGFSGAWFTPSRDGEGFIVEVVGESMVLVYWFTYDSDGKQMWLLGVDELDDEKKANIVMERTSGGRFGTEFNPQGVSFSEWGEILFEFDDCEQAAYDWSAPAPYNNGGFNLARLTTLKNIICENPSSAQ